MKKKGLALLLAICMSVGSLGNITSHALEIQTETQTEGTSNEIQEGTGVEITGEVTDGTVEEETTEGAMTETEQTESEPPETEPEENEPVENAELDVESNDSEVVVEETEETTEQEERVAAETTGDFHGEIEADETSVSVVDENGNITYVDMSKDDTIVEETATFRAATPQIVNFRYKSGVIEYTEPATGTPGYTAGSYGADAAYLGRNGNKVKFMLAGVIGEVPAGNVQVISKSSAKSVSHYYISNGRLLHSIATNVNSSNYGSTLDNGPAPSYLKSGVKYYSYDGHYFYTEENFGNMLDDYNLETRAHSVNPNNPYYNYFQYLPFRSQSNYSGSSLNTALNNRVTSTSKMKNTGTDFANHQNTYGAHALLMIGIAANESGWGTSSIARNKNNLFGLNAVDSSPGQSANYFASVSQCIKEFAERWLSKEYLNPKNWKHYGSFLGNKASGMNVKYASDPYWGEKAATMAWLLDRTNGNKDAFKYTIGIKDMIRPANSVNVRKESNTSSTKFYTTKKNSGLAFLILNNTSTNKFYKIQSEPVLNSGRTAIDSKSGVYDFKNMYAYISSDYVKIVNKGNGSQTEPETPSSKNGWITEGGKKYYYVNGEKVKGERKIDGKWYCFDSKSGAMITGWHNLPGKKVYYKSNGEIAYGEQFITGKWYMFKPGNGAMVTGWYKHPGKKVYYKSNGEIAYGEQFINGKWYMFKPGNGAMVTGWYNHPGKRVYYKSNGEIAYGEQFINGKWYMFKPGNGAMVTGWYKHPTKKVYYKSNGEIAYGEQKIDGKWYYLKEGNGEMLTDTWVKGHYYNQDGVRVS